MSVSYTHLDEYKRQHKQQQQIADPDRPAGKHLDELATRCKQRRNQYDYKPHILNQPDTFSDCSAPVSYTHLDVYKRQVVRHQDGS